MNKKYIEKFSRNIFINTDNLKEQCEFFIKDIEKNVKKYNKYIKDENAEFKKMYKDDKKIIFTPENLLNVSPITILDAPWGAGKTFFIESLCKYVINNEINLNYIKNIMVIDSWKYSISNAIPNEFIFYLIENLAVALRIKDKAKKLFVNFLNFAIFPWINWIFHTSLKMKNKELKDWNIDKVISELNNYINEPVLIIVDNIERIGENGWDILKTIQKLAMLNNLIFVLPMNKDKLVSEKLKNSEWKIEKYINIPFYKFKQDYKGLLKKYNINDDLSDIFNDLLSTQIDGECLSIRELDKILLSEENIEEVFKNKYIGLINFKKIWPMEEEIKNIILNDIQTFTLYIKDILKDIDLFNNLFNSNEYNNITNLVSKYTSINIENPKTLTYFEFLEKIYKNNKNLENYFVYKKNINNIDFEKLIKSKEELKKKNEQEKLKCDKEIINIDNKIKKLENWITKYESGEIKKTVNNNKKYSMNNNELITQRNGLSDWEQTSNNLLSVIDGITSDINEIIRLKNDIKELMAKATDNIVNISKTFKDNIKLDKNLLVIFNVLFKNKVFLENYNIEDIYSTYEYFINEIIN